MSFLKYPGRINAKSLFASALVHIVLFSAFAFMNLDKADISNERSSDKAGFLKVENLIPVNRVYSKPEIIKPGIGNELNYNNDNSELILPDIESKNINPKAAIISSSSIIDSIGQSFFDSVEFFGTKSSSKKICFVLDASGSMQGHFNTIKLRLINSISSMQPNQYFSIYIFSDGRIFKSPEDGFYRCSEKNIKSASNFINSIRPKGKTNAVQTLKKAFMACSGSSQDSIIFFLTDGFELYQSNPEEFVEEIISYQKSLAPKTVINTIGYRGNKTSNQILKQIAEKSGGKFSFAN